MIVKGQKINGRYEVLKLIGEGGMANVYLGYDIILKRDVAIKVLRGDLADDDKFIRRFKREAQSASLLNHPNIVQIYDVGEEDGNFYIVMEYIKGITLKQLIKKRGYLSVPEVIDITSQLTDGLSSAHDSYIIHRDIKPQNIMILSDGMVKITDFGIAMAINASDLTQTNSVMGSVHYLPPEQAAGKGSTIKSDIYSLGILMYEMLAGTMPFRGTTAVEIALKHIKNSMPSIKASNPKVPQALENVILKATAKNPKNRYNSVRELYDDLKTCNDKERENEKRIVFKYPEDDLEQTKVMSNLKEELNKKDDNKEEPIVKSVDENDYKKKLPKSTKILIIACSSIILLFIFLIFIVPLLTRIPDATVPDVTGYSISKATNTLEKKGFKVSETIKTDYTDEVKKGKVSKTNPAARKTVKKGTTIILYKSLGSSKIKINDYSEKDYNEIKAKLEVKGLEVMIDKKDVDDKSKYIGKENLIIDQSTKSGSYLLKGDTITLFIPNIVKSYPDFVKESWTIDEVQSFCDEYGIKLTVEEKEVSENESGVILSQSKTAGSDISVNSTLKIVVSKKIETMVPYNDSSEDQTESSNYENQYEDINLGENN